MKLKTNFSQLISFLLLLLSFAILYAQPSGGPYGPAQLNYELPKISGKIIFVSPNGDENNSGENLENPTTLKSAIDKINSGDAIILRGGIYRTGNLIFNQKIIMQPYKDEHPILKGTFVAENWENLGNGLWVTKWEYLFPSKPDSWWRRNREGKITAQHKFNNDMVFADGLFLQSAGWEGEVDENSFFIDYEDKNVYIGIDPTNKLIEITAFNVALIRTTKNVNGKISDKKGPEIHGITFTQYAYRAIEIEGTEPEGLANPADFGKDVVGTTFKNCTISYCSRVAAYIRGDNLIIKNCMISDTSTEGLYVLSSSNVLLEKNIFRRNNIEQITGYYPAAVKIFNQTYRVTCNDNLVIEHPFSNGIWYDVGNVDGVFTNNWIQDVGFVNTKVNENQVWPSQNGFFFEISQRAICTGNVFVNCDHAILVLNSSDVKIYQNTFVNSMAVMGRDARSAQGDHFGWHPSTGPDVDERINHVFVNNLLTADENFHRPLFLAWQSEKLCGKLSDSQLKEFDNNVYVRKNSDEKNPIIWWGPSQNEKCFSSYSNLESFKKQNPNFEKSGIDLTNYNGPLFKNSILGNYQLIEKFPYAKNASELPKEISKYFNHKNNFVGAFEPIE